MELVRSQQCLKATSVPVKKVGAAVCVRKRSIPVHLIPVLMEELVIPGTEMQLVQMFVL